MRHAKGSKPEKRSSDLTPSGSERDDTKYLLGSVGDIGGIRGVSPVPNLVWTIGLDIAPCPGSVRRRRAGVRDQFSNHYDRAEKYGFHQGENTR